MPKKIGQFWYKRLIDSNELYLVGSIEITGGCLKNIRIFRNNYKSKKEQPDLKAYYFEDREK